jgi:Rap1a immunity proteins
MCRPLITLTFASLLVTSANAQPGVTGEQMLQPCTHALLGSGDNSLDWMPMGFCIGVISGIARTAPHLDPGSQFCVPAEATRDVQLATVVHYLESHTERLQEDFVVLAFQALQKTWPCPEAPPVTPEAAASQPGAPSKTASVIPNIQLAHRGDAQTVESPNEEAGQPAETARPPKATRETNARDKPRRTATGPRKKARQRAAWTPFEMFVFGFVPPRTIRP